MTDLEKYEKDKYCTQCWEDWKNFVYMFTCSSWDVFDCKICNTKKVIWFYPSQWVNN